ncbi:MAG TPA: hypothetical protein PKE04_11620, partial [Clostridia bacterium]|nr:hypothetical protein [Clostridia bacterium]
AIKVWQTNAAATKLPSISIAEADSDEYNKIFTEIDDFTKEYTALAINGTYDLANYQSEYLDVLNDIGIDRVFIGSCT